MPINIHGKQYITVAERVQAFHEANKGKTIDITTEVLQHEPQVVVQAKIATEQGIFTGISAANPSKSIEKMSPYEVAETSAVGRALGFAGYEIVEGIATADEIVKADPTDDWEPASTVKVTQVEGEIESKECPIHKESMTAKNGKWGVFYSHKLADGSWCNGK